ncbi:peptide ABC transporter substrate-binding protein [Ectobacillus sp. JY-23]|uniref:peptide ABC transporter substrate-binding protein n=1 Tax=Ectobacillus sp. JY-23 TaxID=2933872 RepID=UPI001FF3AD55|nr:peptide ABC transporter substrate-binding protein [Ectobacillus sp. JY-23]UOY91244.1 peptide ABC transporter substrate-binding protein [Ectobacillus sp. JY-23]
MKKGFAIVMATMLAVSAGCTAKQETATTEKGKAEKKVLRLNNGKEPTSFDPPIGFDNVSWVPLNNLGEGLTRLGKTHKPEAAAAESWKVSPDGKTYTFKLRKDAKWSNGEPVTAKDFEFAWKRMLSPELASSAAFLAYFIEGAEEYNTGKGSVDNVKIKAVGDYELEVVLTSPQAFFLSVISNPSFFPVPQKIVEKDPNWFKEAATFVGNGPFKLTKWEHGSEMVFEKNKHYWDNKSVKLDEIKWAMVNDVKTEYQMYKTGELDVSSVPAELAEKLLKDGEAKAEDQAGIEFYRFNLKQAPFQNAKIRQAFAMSIDQAKIAQYVKRAGQKPAYGFVGFGFKDANGKDFRQTSGDLLKTDTTKAKQLLEEGMKEENYKTLPEVTLTYNTSDTNKPVAEAIQQMIKESLGVDIKLANMEWNVFSTEQKAGKFQFSRGSFLADYGDPVNFLENFTTDNSMNRTSWSSTQFDELIAKSKKEGDEKKRFEYLYEAEKLLMKDASIVPLYFYNQVYLQQEKVTGVVRHPVGYLELKWADLK